MILGFASLCRFMPVYAGINWHKPVYATVRHKLSFCRHFANPGRDHPPSRGSSHYALGLQTNYRLFDRHIVQVCHLSQLRHAVIKFHQRVSSLYRAVLPQQPALS